MDKEDLPYNFMIEQRDGTCDHVDTMRRPNERKGTLALLHKSPWMGRQVKEQRKEINKEIKEEK